MMEGDRTLPGVAFVAASGRAFLFLRFYCAAILPVFCLAFFTQCKDCYVCRVLLYVVGGEKYTYDRKYT